MKAHYVAPDRAAIQDMFTRIAPRYDFLNSFLSLGLDRTWRDGAADRILDGGERTLLDIGTGTGRFLKTFQRRGNFDRLCGLDLSGAMLEKGKRAFSESTVFFLQGDGARGIPFRDGSFDLVTASFVLRSIRDLEAFFAEARRVLVPGGKAAFLELTRPDHFLLRALYIPYLKIIVPLVGGLVSRSGGAYTFLSASITQFPDACHLQDQLQQSGFKHVRISSFTGGMVKLIVGVKV